MIKQPEYVLCDPHNEKHISHYDTLLTTIEGRLEGKRGRGRPRRTCVDDLPAEPVMIELGHSPV